MIPGIVNIELCPDCAERGMMNTTIMDQKFGGRVCPKCQRIFKFTGGNGTDKNYVTKKAAIAAIRDDALRKRHRYNSTKAMVDRIVRPID